jgi:hypothetical protein
MKGPEGAERLIRGDSSSLFSVEKVADLRLAEISNVQFAD